MKTVIEMARDAGAIHIHKNPKEFAVVGNEAIERFAALVVAAAVRETSAEYRMGWNDGQVAEREAVSDEWSMCVQSDLEHGVKCLNEQAAKDWFKNYPEISKFGAWLSARGQV